MIRSQTIRFSENGGPEVLKLEDVEVPLPQSGEALIRHHAIGVNFIETYYRSGLYKTPLPSGLGTEGSGVVEVIGKDVTHLKVGDRVAYALGPLGAYSQRRTMPAWQLVKIPDAVTFEEAASVMLKGLTVYYLFKETHKLQKDETILFHAAAGGVGLIACQWARHLGAKLIGTVSSAEKSQVALAHGAWATIDYKKEDILESVLKLTGGEKLPVVYDGVGKTTWEDSLDCLRTRGLMVSFGNASGAVRGVDLGTLAQHGSLYVTRPTLGSYMSTQEKLQQASGELFDLVIKKVIRFEKSQTFALKDAAEAHRELLSTKRVGGLLLIPEQS